MSKRPQRTPSYCLHKASGQAVVRIDGVDHYLGKYGSPESKAEYDRLIAEWLGNGRRLSPPTVADGLTVAELILAYWQWAERYYRDERGGPARSWTTSGPPSSPSAASTATPRRQRLAPSRCGRSRKPW
jgi:hypothetical protein